jgi:hypothetical protein
MYWLTGRQLAVSTHNKLVLYRYWSPCGPMTSSYGDARNRAISP